MSAQHFKSLLFKSAIIQEEIVKEHGRRWPDPIRLLKLKKMRLAIKDRLQRLAKQSMQRSSKKETTAKRHQGRILEA